MRTVDIDDAAATLEQLVDLAATGEEIVILRAGQPVARLMRFREPRKLGTFAGQVRIGDDFDDPLPDDVMAAFYGEKP
jgi:antitoxin (DNA-binding transcriptional repressor) of toxin-antitoxin stability system